MPKQLGRMFLITGIPGTGVAKSLNKYIQWLLSSGQFEKGNEPVVVKLEDKLTDLAFGDLKRILKIKGTAKQAKLFQVLTLPRKVLGQRWQEAFDFSLAQANAHLKKGRDVFFTFHACWYHLGTEEHITAVDFGRLAKAPADSVITLIDDIYDVRSRLSATGEVLEATNPDVSEVVDVIIKLIRILDWRAFEISFSERIASTCAKGRHFVLAVKHPLKTFHELLYSDKKRAYLSHHITEPRRMLVGTEYEKAEAKSVIENIHDLSRGLRDHLVLFEPTAIAEAK